MLGFGNVSDLHVMDHDNSMDANLGDLYLDQEAMDPPSSSIAFSNESESAHDRVEERIRQLQGVTVRAGQRNPVEITYISRDNLVNTDFAAEIVDDENIGTVDMNAEKRRRGCKRDSSHLVGKALALAWVVEPPAKKVDKESANFYDCNICLDIAKDPVLTCCGHLFCWACFYQVEYIDSTSKECPVCKGEVSDRSVIPIYGNGAYDVVTETESGLKVPPRPKARRVESVRNPPD